MLKRTTILISFLWLISCSNAGFLGSTDKKTGSETSSEQPPSPENPDTKSSNEVIDDLIEENGKDGITKLPHDEMQRLCKEIPTDQVSVLTGNDLTQDLTIVKSIHIKNTGNDNTIKGTVTEKISVLCITAIGNGSALTINVEAEVGFIYFVSASNGQNLTVNVAKNAEIMRVAGALTGNDAHVTVQGEGKYMCPTNEDVTEHSATISCK